MEQVDQGSARDYENRLRANLKSEGASDKVIEVSVDTFKHQISSRIPIAYTPREAYGITIGDYREGLKQHKRNKRFR